jgi:hypothetical protein
MKSFLKKFINKLLKFPINIKLIKFIEEIAQNFQGKGNGWGINSIENEIKNCLLLLKIILTSEQIRENTPIIY